MVRRGCAQRPEPDLPARPHRPRRDLRPAGAGYRAPAPCSPGPWPSGPTPPPPVGGGSGICQRARGGRAEQQRTGLAPGTRREERVEASERPLPGRPGALRKGREAGRVRGPRRGSGGTWAAAVRTVPPPRRGSVPRGLPGDAGEAPPARPSARESRSRVRRSVRTRRPRARATVTEQGRRRGGRAGRAPSVRVAAPRLAGRRRGAARGRPRRSNKTSEDGSLTRPVGDTWAKA